MWAQQNRSAFKNMQVLFGPPTQSIRVFPSHRHNHNSLFFSFSESLVPVRSAPWMVISSEPNPKSTLLIELTKKKQLVRPKSTSLRFTSNLYLGTNGRSSPSPRALEARSPVATVLGAFYWFHQSTCVPLLHLHSSFVRYAVLPVM